MYLVYINPIHVKSVPLFASLCAVFYIDFELRDGSLPHILQAQHQKWWLELVSIMTSVIPLTYIIEKISVTIAQLEKVQLYLPLTILQLLEAVDFQFLVKFIREHNWLISYDSK